MTQKDDGLWGNYCPDNTWSCPFMPRFYQKQDMLTCEIKNIIMDKVVLFTDSVRTPIFLTAIIV